MAANLVISDSNSWHSEHMLARLHLEAVLPALAELPRLDEIAHILTNSWRFNLQISTMSGLSNKVVFDLNRQHMRPTNDELPSLNLLYLTDRQLNNSFRKRGFHVPILTGGFRFIPVLGKLQKLGAGLTHVLDPSSDPAIGQQPTETRVKLLIGTVIPNAIVQLANHDKTLGRLLHAYDGAVALFRLRDQDLSWIECDQSCHRAGQGSPPRAPDLIVNFGGADTVTGIVDGRLDKLLAVGRGDIRVQGLVPLAERLDVLMDYTARLLQ